MTQISSYFIFKYINHNQINTLNVRGEQKSISNVKADGLQAAEEHIGFHSCHPGTRI